MFPEYHLIRKYGEDIFTNVEKAKKVLKEEASDLKNKVTEYCQSQFRERMIYELKFQVDAEKAMDEKQKAEVFEMLKKEMESKADDQCFSLLLPESIKAIIKSDYPGTVESFKVVATSKSTFCATKFTLSKEFKDLMISFPGKAIMKNKKYGNDLEEKLKKRAQAIELIQKNPQVARDGLVNQCRQLYHSSIAMLPESVDSEKFKTMVNTAKTRVAEKALGFLSQTSRKKLKEEIIPHLVFVPPPAKGSFKDKFLNSLRIEVTNLKKELENFQTGYWSLNLESAEQQKAVDADLLQLELSSLCTAHAVNPIPDQTYTPEGGITVGPFSVIEPNFGIPTIMHEIGHNISAQLRKENNLSEQSQQSYQRVMNCLSQKHPERTDGFYSEEDFADSIEAAGLEDASANPWCAIVRDANRVSVISADSVVNGASFDVHSSTLFRLLHESQIQKRMLPNDCSSYLTQTGQERNFSACATDQSVAH